MILTAGTYRGIIESSEIKKTSTGKEYLLLKIWLNKYKKYLYLHLSPGYAPYNAALDKIFGPDAVEELSIETLKLDVLSSLMFDKEVLMYVDEVKYKDIKTNVIRSLL